MIETKLRRQYGALPWFRDAAGEVRVVLITTRETGRWSIPRGNPMKGKDSRQAASIEAYEEAGVRGRMGKGSLGVYDYGKRVGTVVHPTRVKVYPLLVAKRLRSWPEAEQRQVEDFDVYVAATLVDERELAEIIVSFAPKGGMSKPSLPKSRDAVPKKAPAAVAKRRKDKVPKIAPEGGKGAKTRKPKTTKAKLPKAKDRKSKASKVASVTLVAAAGKRTTKSTVSKPPKAREGSPKGTKSETPDAGVVAKRAQPGARKISRKAPSPLDPSRKKARKASSKRARKALPNVAKRGKASPA